jgi:hypothetical protein
MGVDGNFKRFISKHIIFAGSVGVGFMGITMGF